MKFFNHGVVVVTSIYKLKHKKWIFPATIYLTRKRLIFPGRLLKTDHLKKLKRGGRLFKNPRQGGPKNEKTQS